MLQNNTLPNKIILAGIALVAFCVAYSATLRMGFFTMDDAWMLLGFTLVYPDQYSWPWVMDVFTVYNNLTYSPLITLYFHGLYLINGLDPYYYHLGSLLIQMVDAVLLYFLSKMILRRFHVKYARPIAYFASVIWLVHPIQAEAVTWIAAVKFGLANFFVFIGFMLYIQLTKQFSWWKMALCVLCVVCACLNKEQGIFTPYLFIAFSLCTNRKGKRWIYINLVLLAATAVFVYINMHLSAAAPFRPAESYPVWYRICFAARALFIYLGKMVVPYPLQVYYPFPIKPGAAMPFYYYAFPLLFIALYWFLYRVFARKGMRDLFLFCSLFFFINIAMCLQVFPMGVRSNGLAPRYMYLPSIPVIYLLLIAVPFARLANKAYWLVGIFITLLVIYCYFYVNSWAALQIS